MKENMELSNAVNEVINQGEQFIIQSKKEVERSMQKFNDALECFENDVTKKEKSIQEKIKILENEHSSLKQEKARVSEDYAEAVAAGNESAVKKNENLLFEVDAKIKECKGRMEYLKQYSITADKKLYKAVLAAYNHQDNLLKRTENQFYGQIGLLKESIRKIENLLDQTRDVHFHPRFDRKIVEVYEKFNGKILDGGANITNEEKCKLIKYEIAKMVI